jgi:two-component sensor histidine kinase
LLKIDLQPRIPISVSIALLLFACRPSGQKVSLGQFKQDSALVSAYIHKGDSIYAQKNSYSAFSKSLELYDSAWLVAVKTNDTSLLAQAIFAKGRAYDAINNNQQKTIDYYTEAAQLYARLPGKEVTALYIKHLVAHSYDKVLDSANCIKTLKELYSEIRFKPDSVKQQLHFMPEMALISTVVKNYVLADSILQHLTKRDWIKNDSTEYDYLNHYYLTKAKINVLEYRNYNSPYMDSIENVFAHSRNLNDSTYYSNELWELFKAMGNKAKEGYYLQLNNTVFNKFNSPESVRETKEKLAKMEVAAVEEKEKAATEKARNRTLLNYLLAAFLAAIAAFAFFLNKKNKQAKLTNQLLAQKNQQNELLNKEIHHRVKNNLEMIASLVYMQERNTDTEEVKENMQNISLRIESIANLHHQLMEQADSVELKVYIQQLVANVTRLLGDNKNVLTYLEIEPMVIPQKISFPLGLIINEWITNSVKYAVPATAPLTIFIEIYNGNNEIQVNYRDNGKPQAVKPDKKSLGLDIVNLLTAQLKTTVKTDTENIFSYHVIIPFNSGE